ncbi:putative membrane protein [Paenibacillus phage vB_PlaP_API480]|nr:putative membrane protein [Paenibacillus phage vB_PlaP_API480]
MREDIELFLLSLFWVALCYSSILVAGAIIDIVVYFIFGIELDVVQTHIVLLVLLISYLVREYR